MSSRSTSVARDLFVYVPGITGTTLKNGDRVIWDASLPAYLALLTSDARRQELRDMDGVAAGEVIEMPFVVPGIIKSVGPLAIEKALFSVLAFTKPTLTRIGNYHRFGYDWRRSNRESAENLRAFIDEKLRQWRAQAGSDAQVIVITHSMGGLVTRYWAEVLRGWKQCRAIFTIGSPLLGSVSIADYLANGFRDKGVDLSEVLRTYQSAYELLPIYRALKRNGEWVRIWDTPDVAAFDNARARDGRRFHQEIADAIAENHGDENYRRWRNIRPLVGWGQKTPQSLREDGGRITASFDPPDGVDAALADGDGRVPRVSGVPKELDGREVFAPDTHAGVQRNDFLLQHPVQQVIGMQVKGSGPVLGKESTSGAKSAVAVEIDDLFRTDEEVTMTITPSNPKFAEYRVIVDGGGTPHKVNTGDSTIVSLGKLPPGTHSVRVESERFDPDAPSAVHDLFEVMGA